MQSSPSPPPKTKTKTGFFGAYRERTFHYFIAAAIVTVAAIGISIGLAFALLIDDVEYSLPLEPGSRPPVLSIAASLLSVDPIAGTLVMDWYPQFLECPTNATYDIYMDQNLLINEGGSDDKETPSNQPPSDPVFRMSGPSCEPTLKDSFATFRTTFKLISNPEKKRLGTLQAYPFDVYRAQIGMYAVVLPSNESVSMYISQTWGVAVNFQVDLDKEHFNNDEGLYLLLSATRSTAVKLFVLVIVIGNWMVTIVFLWVTIACTYWKEKVVKELFAVPVAVLFALTAVRASMPGAPAAFGALIDFAGILPNLVLITLSSFVLLMVVLWDRVSTEVHERRLIQQQEQEEKENAQNGEVTRPEEVLTPGTEKETPGIEVPQPLLGHR